MKNKSLISLLILSSFILTGCELFSQSPSSSSPSSDNDSTSDTSSSEPPHTHTFSEEWNYNETQHWHDATCGHDVKSDLGNHQFVNVSATDEGYVDRCRVCQYERTREHSYSSSWTTDENYHWHACVDAGFTHLKKDYGEHQLVLMGDDNDGYHYTCETCGYSCVTPHHFATAWSVNATHHWHACTDVGYETLVSDYGEHQFSNERVGDYVVYTCDVCGHTYQEIYQESPIDHSATMTTYFSLDDTVTSTVYFMRDYPDVPYVIFKDFYGPHYGKYFWNYSFTFTQTRIASGLYDFENSNFVLTIDTNEDTLAADGYNFLAMIATNTANNVSLLTRGGETNYCKVTSAISRRNRGNILIDCAAHNIDLISYDNIVYIPLATFNDVFLAGNNARFVYNGKDFYCADSFKSNKWASDLTANSLEAQFYNDSPWKNVSTRSQSLATFTYNELCLSLDYYYGLKNFRGVNTFNEFLTSMGYRTNLLSTNTNTYENEMVKFVSKWLYEGHSSFARVSPFRCGTSFQSTYSNSMLANDRYVALVQNAYSDLNNRRNNAGKGIGVTYSGNTAIITFDSFKKLGNGAASYVPNLGSMSYSTLHNNDSELFFHKAFNDIQATSGIVNVVIDLTLNGGGALNAIPWLLGYLTDDPYLIYETTITGEISEVHYQVDLERNGTYGDDLDSFGDQYNIFLMTSAFSFSCGNLFPTLVKDGHMATIIGETSGGGACAVGFTSTACGTMFQSSSMFRFVYKDSSNNYILNENGIAPDYTFSRDYFYNDAQINTFVNSLIA